MEEYELKRTVELLISAYALSRYDEGTEQPTTINDL